MKIAWGLIFSAAIQLIILANLVILDLVIFLPQKTPITAPNVGGCGAECQRQIEAQVASVVASLPKPSPTASPKTITNARGGALPIKEFFVPLGNGSTQNNQWEDISGVEAYINTDGYTGIDTVYFEAALHIPTKNGIVSARLYNVTDKHPVWFSEVSTGSDTAMLVSTPIKLEPGNKLYRVQMKTSLRYLSLLDFARVKIITK